VVPVRAHDFENQQVVIDFRSQLLADVNDIDKPASMRIKQRHRGPTGEENAWAITEYWKLTIG
jgi:hypothetical protein